MMLHIIGRMIEIHYTFSMVPIETNEVWRGGGNYIIVASSKFAKVPRNDKSFETRDGKLEDRETSSSLTFSVVE